MEDLLNNLRGQITPFEDMIKTAANTHMLTKLKKKTAEEVSELIEPIWLIKEIKKEISSRRNTNKKKGKQRKRETTKWLTSIRKCTTTKRRKFREWCKRPRKLMRGKQ